ncbi:MAG: heat-inducible transcriptional repressor HrcA [Actinobacteria bacterium]|nr:heat-inducible transcriptional repressor HrcA [Actinomycetota bacterium]
MIDTRKAAILRAIVRDYVKNGQPVSSQLLARRYRLKVSPATIRNDMGVLEELGYISQPHTSAGRIPTDLGYRWFIDNWPGSTWPELTREEQKAIAVVSRGEFGGLEDALDATSHVLSEVTEATAVVVAPPARKNKLTRLELLRRSARRATLLLIADTGIVRQGVVEFPTDRTATWLEEISRKLNEKLDGIAFQDLAATMRNAKGISAKDAGLFAGALEKILTSDVEERIYRGGTANILSPDKFADLSTAHEVIEALEKPPLLSSLLESVRAAGAMLVYIGDEVPIEHLRACAVIFTPYDAGSDRTGTVGVVGPTRMDYPHTISAVESVARALSHLLDPSED